MATGNRTLKLSILADVDELKKSLKQGEVEVQGFGDKVSDFGKKAAAAFAIAAAAAAAYATKLAVDGVKAAIEDEAAQLRLASALKSATGATDAQIQATEDYISKTSLAIGIADDELRPAFQRLATATGDVTKSQQLLNLALDISKGTGKDLGAVTEALSKSFNGQDTQLVRLGIGLNATQAKTMSFKDQVELLSNLYGGAAQRNAETFQGRIDRLKVLFDETKESIGQALLPVIERLIGYIFQYGTPIVDKFKSAWNTIQDAIERNRQNFNEFAQLLREVVFPIVSKIFGFLIDVGAKAAAAIVSAFGTIVGAITPVLNFVIDAINKVIDGINLVKKDDIQKLSPIRGGSVGGGLGSRPLGRSTVVSALGSLSGGLTGLTGAIAGAGGAGGLSASQSSKIMDQLSLAYAQGFDILRMATGTMLNPSATPFGQVQPVTINIGVAGDPEGTARTIIDVLNNSQGRGGAYIGTPFGQA
jgi:hypothetical protein